MEMITGAYQIHCSYFWKIAQKFGPFGSLLTVSTSLMTLLHILRGVLSVYPGCCLPEKRITRALAYAEFTKLRAKVLACCCEIIQNIGLAHTQKIQFSQIRQHIWLLPRSKRLRKIRFSRILYVSCKAGGAAGRRKKHAVNLWQGNPIEDQLLVAGLSQI